MKLIVRQAKSHRGWSPNDSVDFAHAVIAVACSEFVLLDKKWRDRMKLLFDLGLPRDCVRIYYRAELDEFLEDFQWHVAAVRDGRGAAGG